MRDLDLTPLLKIKMAKRPRVRGRYNSSELYFINEGKLTPEEWINPKETDMQSVLRMWSGIGLHEQLEGLLGKEKSERKVEYQYKGMTLVGKVDYEPSAEELWEFKTSDRKINNSKPWHDHQTKLYCSMFEKKMGAIYQPVKNKDGLYLKLLGSVTRDDEWFKEELDKLYAFHLKVEELWKLIN